MALNCIIIGLKVAINSWCRTQKDQFCGCTSARCWKQNPVLGCPIPATHSALSASIRTAASSSPWCCGLTMLTGTWKILEGKLKAIWIPQWYLLVSHISGFKRSIMVHPFFSDSNLSDIKEKKRDIFSWTIERWQYLLAVPCGMGVPGSSTKTANRAKIGYVPQHPRT